MTHPIRETQNEAQEIITNVTRDYRAGNIELWQWLEVTRRAMKDAFLAMLGHYDEEKG